LNAREIKIILPSLNVKIYFITIVQINKTALKIDFVKFLDSISFLSNSNSNLASFSVEIPAIKIVTLITSNIIRNEDIFYWKIKNENLEFLAYQPILNINEFGEYRLTKTSVIVNEIEKKFQSNWASNNLINVPLIVGGIKFAPDQNGELWENYSDSDWFIPKVLFLKRGDKVFLIYNFFIASDLEKNARDYADVLASLESLILNENLQIDEDKLNSPIFSNSVDTWKAIINKALQKISEGMLSKVVLSREVKLQLNQKPNIPGLLEQLSERYPKCYTFAFQRGNSIFIGASPEKLAKISDGWIEVDALAGSAPRGKTEIEDLEMENYLLNSEKNLFEQRAVVNFIHNLLSKISDEIIFDDKPIIRKLPNIQHLWTVIKAKLNSDYKLFDLLMKLHPTPAICGDPWKIAKDFILEEESHNRGLYSGNIGWFNFEGTGEFAVAIRTALIKSNQLYAYAGCGIVEGSEANAEFEESEIKLKPILSLFVDEKIYQS